MATLSIYNEIIQILEQHPNSKQIKKLIFYANNNSWESDTQKLSKYKLEDLVEELHQSHSTIAQLRIRLFKLVKTLNKHEQYFSIAKVIISQLSKLYINPQILEKAPSSKSSDLSVPEKIVSSPSHYREKGNQFPKHNCTYNSFCLRLEILKYVTPLRAKLLIFSTLHQSDNQDPDWLLLKTYELDDLLLNLFNKYPKLSDLKERINATAQDLESPEENLQAANVILRSLQPLYANSSGKNYEK